ncbi:MAG TPA: MCP four helix bundle domain-containing protein [Pedobacter sp.]
MKWTFVIHQKLKVAVLLGVVMGAVVMFNIILQKNISNINNSVNSIYQDRLIPATDIFYLSENMHQRQSIIEQFLYRNGAKVEELKALLHRHDQKMFSLIDKYEKTYLVKEESMSLKKFKQSIADYSRLENEVLALNDAGKDVDALRLYETAGRPSLESTITQLTNLTTIQSTVGEKLVNDTKGIVATSNFLSDLQMVLAIIIGLIITSLVVSSKIINQPQAKFRWN